MTLVFVPLGWWVAEAIVAPRLGSWTGPLQPSTVAAGAAATDTGSATEVSPPGMAPGASGPAVSAASEKRGLRAAMIAAAAVITLFAVLAWPALWSGVTGGAPLYDESVGPNGRLEQGLQPLFQAMVAGFFLLFLATGIAYGRATGVNKSHRDEIRMISEGMTDMAYYIVLAFVAAHFVALFNWSSLGAILAIKGAATLVASGLPTPVLLVGIVLLAASINLGIGSASAKWAMLAPVLVPMLMLLNVSPEMTTAAFRMGDSVTNPITPLMVYFPLILAFCQRWDPRFGMGGLIATMLPFSLTFLLAGLVMTFGWVALELPLGPGAEVSYSIPLSAPTP
jgi:aminobenzoyl-glutamate transport protein